MWLQTSAVLTNEAVAFVPTGGRLSGQHAGLDFPKGLKYAFDVVIGEVRMNRRHVDPVEGSSFFSQLVDNWLSLADVTGPPHLSDEEMEQIQNLSVTVCAGQ